MAKPKCGCKTPPKGRKTVKVHSHRRRPPRNCGAKTGSGTRRSSRRRR